MNEAQALTKIDYLTLLLWVFVILSFVKICLSLYDYYKKRWRIKTGKELDKETVETRLTTLEKHDNWQYQEIQKISKGIDDIKDRLDINEKETNQRIIVQYGAELYNLHSKFMTQKYVTRAGLETFQLLADTYIACGGNHSIKGKIIPEVMALEIKDE